MADGDGGSPVLVNAENFDGELEEHWEDAEGRKVAFTHFGYVDPLDVGGA